MLPDLSLERLLDADYQLRLYRGEKLRRLRVSRQRAAERKQYGEYFTWRKGFEIKQGDRVHHWYTLEFLGVAMYDAHDAALDSVYPCWKVYLENGIMGRCWPPDKLLVPVVASLTSPVVVWETT
jgi:hypothetical protein